MVEVVAAVILSSDKIYICKRPNKGTLANLWEFPGGKVERGETNINALSRELKEECAISINSFSFITTTIYKYPNFTVKLSTYLCEYDKSFSSLIHQDEKWVPIEDLDSYNFAPADLETIEILKKKLAH